MKKIYFWVVLIFAFSPLLAGAIPKTLDGRQPLRFPIVLVHGATEHGSTLKIAFFDFGEYFRNIPAFYANTKTPVYVASLTTDGSIEERAAVLKNFLQTEVKGKMVNVIGHSLGGLDARYAASVLGARQIASITTIGTPHRGSPLADWTDRQAKRGTPWYWIFRLFGYDIRRRRFLPELTTEFMEKRFNPNVRNLPDVRYFSVVSGTSFRQGHMSYLLWFTSNWLEGEHHPMAINGHDGLVPMDSQVWGKEILRVNTDHLGQMNHHEFRAANDDEISLNIYTAIYDNLLKNGL